MLTNSTTLKPSVEIAGTALNTFAFLALSNVLYFATFNNGLHLNLSAARTEKFMRRYCSTSVFAYLTHIVLLYCKFLYKKLLPVLLQNTLYVYHESTAE